MMGITSFGSMNQSIQVLSSASACCREMKATASRELANQLVFPALPPNCGIQLVIDGVVFIRLLVRNLLCAREASNLLHFMFHVAGALLPEFYSPSRRCPTACDGPDEPCYHRFSRQAQPDIPERTAARPGMDPSQADGLAD